MTTRRSLPDDLAADRERLLNLNPPPAYLCEFLA